MSFATALFRASLALAVSGTVSVVASAQTASSQTQFELDSRREVVCGGESALGNLVANGVRESTSSDVAVVPCNAIRSVGLIAANTYITETELRAFVEVDQIKLIEINGLALLDALENTFASVTPGSNQFPQVSGLRLEVDLRRAVGGRLVRMTVNGAPLEFEKTYRVAVPQTYSGFDAGTALPPPGLSLADALVKYAQTNAPFKVTTFGRIKLAP